MIDLFEAALKQPGWTNDKVPDQFPRAGSKDVSGITPREADNGENHENVNQGKKRGPSRSLGTDLGKFSAKRAKGG